MTLASIKAMTALKAAQECKSLDDVRAAIDIIDDVLIDVLALRAAYVHEVVRFKSKERIVDEKRINRILERQKKHAAQKNLDPQVVEEIWRFMIGEFINMERRLFDERAG